MLLGMLGMMAASGIMLWFGFLAPSRNPGSDIDISIIPSSDETTLDLQILQHPIFDQLGIPSSPSPAPETEGRKNPFVPL